MLEHWCVRKSEFPQAHTNSKLCSIVCGTNNIWSRVREDRDIDDLIFGEESYYGYKEDHTCSER